jgi:hypothetical protein
MTVYLVWSGDEVEPYLERVFSDAELAIWWAKETGGARQYSDRQYWVSAWFVDSDPVQAEVIWRSEV